MKKENLLKLQKVIEYIRDHYQKSIKVNEISEYVGLTPKSLNRILTTQYGYTFAVLLRKYRLYQAARLLHFDYIPTEIVALRCGMKPNYFYNEFKKEFGLKPSEMKDRMLLPDMPVFKQINGYPLSLEYRLMDEVTIEGYPVKIPENQEIDLMWDVSYGFRHPGHKNDLKCEELTWGCWWSDAKSRYRTQYLMGCKVDPDTPLNPDKVRYTMSGGKYAVFSVCRGKNYFETADNAREMAWHAFYSWQILSHKETDKWGFTYEMFDEEKVYLCVPLLSGYGGIEREPEYSSHTLDQIIKYIDEHILEDVDFDKAVNLISGHDIFYRDQFASSYQSSLPDYIWKKKLYVLAQSLADGEMTERQLCRKFHYSGRNEFEKEFKKVFGIESASYQSISLTLHNVDQYYEQNIDKILMEECEISEFRVAGKSLKTMSERNDIIFEIPQMTAYWMKNDFDCLQGTPLAKTKKVAFFEHDEYILGPVLQSEEFFHEELEGRTIPGGKYYAFSCKDSQGNLTEEIKVLRGCIDAVWMYRNWIRTDFTDRTCFYYYDGQKIYYYVPVYG